MSASSVSPAVPSSGARRATVAVGWARSGVDAGFLLVLAGLGLYSFRSVYGGWQYLAVGLIGAVCGIFVAEASLRVWKSVLGASLIAVVVFVVVGSLLAGGSGLGGAVPTPSAISAVLAAATSGWKQLLTTAPPVGYSAHLLAIPFLVGLVAGVGGQGMARRTRSAALPLAVPGGVLALGILFGPSLPTSLLLQGTVFGGVALAWASVRHHRLGAAAGPAGFGRVRTGLAGAVLVVAAMTAGVIGPHLPGAESHTRLVLSRYVVPPFDVNRQPSPLAGFRRYAQGGAQYRTVLFTVAGVRPGAYMRIAVMNEYNGVVWGFGAAPSGGASTTGDAFETYGSTIPVGQPGVAGTVAVTVVGLGGVWMPSLGDVSRVAFTGRDASSAQADYRYDPATSVLAEPAGLQAGERYRLDVVVPPYPSPQALRSVPPGGESLSLSDVPTVLRTDARQWVGSATGAWAKVSAIAAHFKEVGKFSNGTESPTLSLPGESAGRLATFLEGGGLVGNQVVGDDEQYAAALALMSNAVGVPAQVVLGARVGPGGVVRGSDVHAWVEVALKGLGWVPVYPTAFLPSQPPSQSPPTEKPQQASAAPVQPPASSAERSPLAFQLATSSAAAAARQRPRRSSSQSGWVFALLMWAGPPLGVSVCAVAAILGAKARRRHRRRAAPRRSARVAGAWAELVDLERDLGRAVPSRVTRREQAVHLVVVSAHSLARQADAVVFGPGDPTTEQVEEYWRAIERSSAELKQAAGLRARWRAALSLRSLRRKPSSSWRSMGSISANGGV